MIRLYKAFARGTSFCWACGENPKAGLSTAFLPKQGFLKLMAQSRAHTKIPGKASAGGWRRWVQPAIFRLRTWSIWHMGLLSTMGCRSGHRRSHNQNDSPLCSIDQKSRFLVASRWSPLQGTPRDQDSASEVGRGRVQYPGRHQNRTLTFGPEARPNAAC